MERFIRDFEIILDMERRNLKYEDGESYMAALGEKIRVLGGLTTGPVARKADEEIEVIMEGLGKYLIKIEGQATTDYLTGLLNRGRFDELLIREQSLVGSRSRPSSLVYFDIDDFKGFNDDYGHLAGDEVLKGIARIMKNGRPAELPARCGGEEFAVILPETGMDGAFSYAEMLRKSVANNDWFYEGENLGQVTISVGVSGIHTWESLEDILAGVDKAMYEAKGDGKNRVVMRRD